MAETKYGKGISIVSGFDLGAQAPVDSKYVVNNAEEMQAHITGNRAYEGMQVYNLENQKLYIYDGAQFNVLDQSTAVETSVSVSGDVDDVTFKVGSSATSSVALELKKVIEAGEGCKVTVNEKGQVTKVEALVADDIPEIPYTKVTGLGDVVTLNKGTNAGQVVVVGADGKIAEDILPKLAITSTFEVDSEAAMLALDAQEGDVAIRSDLPATFILQKSPASELENWKELATPTDSVLSVNGRQGTVVLTTSDIDEGTNLYYTEDRAIAVFTAQIAKTASTALSDGAKIYRKGEKTILPTDVVEDDTHRFVTDAEKESYADKYTKNEVDNKIADAAYVLPTASATIKGGVMVGTNLSIDASGKLSAIDTTYTGEDGIKLEGTVFKNAGVRNISGADDTLTVDIDGTESTIVVNNVAEAGKATNDANGAAITSYVKNVALDGQKLTITDGAGNTSNLTTKDEQVKNELNTTVKAYLTGTTSATTGIGTQVFDTGVYLTENAGELHATKFVGAIEGTADKAVADANGKVIADTYATIESPTFTGTPSAPTADAATNNDQVATTKFVSTAITNAKADIAKLYTKASKLEFTADTNWVNNNGIYTLTISDVADMYPTGMVFNSNNQSVVVDVVKNDTTIQVVSMEAFAGYLMVTTIL